jgi:phage host-nuclease inhibitor protein Gam
MKMYELANALVELESAIENGDIPEDAIADTLESIELPFEEKADNIACLIKQMAANAEAIKAEEDRLKARRMAYLKRAERLTEYLEMCLVNAKRARIETARNVITFRKTPPKVVIDNEAKFIEWAQVHADGLLNYGKPTVDKTAVKVALENGAEIEGVRIESSQNICIK